MIMLNLHSLQFIFQQAYEENSHLMKSYQSYFMRLVIRFQDIDIYTILIPILTLAILVTISPIVNYYFHENQMLAYLVYLFRSNKKPRNIW